MEMKKYIGIKLVLAQPMTLGKARLGYQVVVKNDGPPETEGYLVEYDTGYQSWCPKKQFEDANRRTDSMPFGHAIAAMKKGLTVRLPKWAPDVFLSIQSPDEHSKMTAQYIYVTSRFGLVPWIPTQIEMLSEEWAFVE
jgi:hypothetical protein